jgi:threonine dehydratase
MLNSINTFVDGAAVKTIGDKTFSILNEVLTDVCLVPEGHICTILMKLFNEEGINFV